MVGRNRESVSRRAGRTPAGWGFRPCRSAASSTKVRTVTSPNLETLTTDECVRLLGQATVGRIAISVGALPVILPVNFVVQDGAIVFRTVAGSKLAAATSQAVVAFEIGDHEPDGRSGWSVMVQGMSYEVNDPDALDQVRRSARRIVGPRRSGRQGGPHRHARRHRSSVLVVAGGPGGPGGPANF